VSGYKYNHNKDNNNNSPRTPGLAPNTIVNDPPRTTPPSNNGKVCSAVEWLNANVKCSNEAEMIAKSTQMMPIKAQPLTFENCKELGKQDVINGAEINKILYAECPRDEKTGQSSYITGMSDALGL
jgi:hypothetical protein